MARFLFKAIAVALRAKMCLDQPAPPLNESGIKARIPDLISTQSPHPSNSSNDQLGNITKIIESLPMGSNHTPNRDISVMWSLTLSDSF